MTRRFLKIGDKVKITKSNVPGLSVKFLNRTGTIKQVMCITRSGDRVLDINDWWWYEVAVRFVGTIALHETEIRRYKGKKV